MTGELLGFFSAILGAIVGGLLTYFSSYHLWRVQLERKRKSIMKKFELEIFSIQQRTNILDIEENGRIVEIIETSVPFYSLNGLFFTYKDEMFDISPETFNKLYRYYTTLINAEAYRQRLPSLPQLREMRKRDDNIDRDYRYMLDEIKEAKRIEVDLIQKLEVEIRKIEDGNSLPTTETLLIGVIILLLIGYLCLFFH